MVFCAGTTNGAALLQSSGVGVAEHLQSLGIKNNHNLPGVGQNLQDHFFARMAFQLNDGCDFLNLQRRGWRSDAIRLLAA